MSYKSNPLFCLLDQINSIVKRNQDKVNVYKKKLFYDLLNQRSDKKRGTNSPFLSFVVVFCCLFVIIHPIYF